MSNIKFAVAESGEKGARSFETAYNFGNNLADAVTLFTEETVFENYVENSRIRLQDSLRRMMKKGATDEELAKFVDAYKVGAKQARIVTKKLMTPEEMLAAIAKMPADLKEKYAAMLATLKQ
jgi:uncharacterized protein YdeI (YjbR/CyaY-like superfamily)